MDISNIDKNFKPAVVDGRDVEYYNVINAPIALEGLPWYEKGKKFYRLPYDMTKDEVNQGALDLSNHTSGVCARFCTDSPFISIRAILSNSCDMNHMTRTGSAGFDIFIRRNGLLEFKESAQPNAQEVTFERILINSTTSEMNEYWVNFPLYGGTNQVEIGILPGSKLLPPPPHAVAAPVLFYGSSITQGGCASRPGNNYCSWLCRAVDAEQINLGFSGSGKGEPAVAQAIATLKLSCFVMDYDWNAETIEELQATHEPFFKIIRQAQPELPIILMSRCDCDGDPTAPIRRDIIRQTYLNSKTAGDKHVWFIDGTLLFGSEDRHGSTVDGCHPNDLGFYRMYRTVLPVLKEALKMK